MKLRKLLPLLMILPLTACGKKPLTIPTVDVSHLEITLPTRPERNTGGIRTAGDFDYIDLYELSDFHGAVFEEEHSSGTYIGLAKLASYFDQKRSSNPGGTILLSAGDMFQGSADSNLTRGYMVNYCFQYMGLDAMAIGNHEFDWTDEWIKNNAELKYNTTSVPYLGANILKDGEIPSFLHKSVVLQRGNYKIGVIGTIGNDLEKSILKSAIEHYEFVNYKNIVDAEAVRLRTEENCNAVVLVSHEDAENMEAVIGIDAAFGGHSHDDKQGNVGGAPSLATKNYGQSVAHVALKFEKLTKTFVGTESAEIVQMSSVASGLSENADVKSIMNQYAPSIDKIKNIKLGKCDAELEFDKALKNLCTQTMFESAVNFVKNDSSYGIDSEKVVCAFQNHKGGIRDNIAKGKIIYGDVYRSFPFDNEIVLFSATGSEIKSKLSALSALGCYRVFEKGSTYFKDDETYYIATTDYLALSSQIGAFKKLEDKDLTRTGLILRDEIANKIYQLKTIKDKVWTANEVCYKSIPTSFPY